MTPNQPIHTIRNAIAGRQSIRWYATRHDVFSEAEQMERLAGDDATAEMSHDIALLILRAYKAECDDPEPVGLGTVE